jgi:tetratricopeptide (TPR) repeat protein
LEHAGRLPEAGEAYRQALAGQEALRRDHPTVSRYRIGVLRAQLRLGELLWATDRPREAAEAFRQVLALGDKLHPEDQQTQDVFAWFLATCADPQFRDARRAALLAKRVVDRVPQVGTYWCTLGAAQYGTGDYREAVRALEKATQLLNEKGSSARFYRAMAHWQLGETDQARQCYDQAVTWMAKQELQYVETRRHRAEAAKLLGIKIGP